MPALLQAGADADLPGGYGVALLQTLLALAAVCILAWVVLKWAAQRGLGIGSGKRVQVIERVGLDARRSLYLVRVGGRVLLLGAGDGGSPSLLAELRPEEIESAGEGGFRSVLEKLRPKEGASSDEAQDKPSGRAEAEQPRP